MFTGHVVEVTLLSIVL